MSSFIILLGNILADLRAAVAPHVDRDRARTPVLLLAWTRIGRAASRLAALYARWQAGTLPRPRAPRPGRPRATAARPRPYFPAGRGWLASTTDYQVRNHASQLQHLLARPDLAAFVAAAPQAGRILRPLCHMLAIAPLPPALDLPARPATDGKPRAPKPSAAPDRPFDRPPPRPLPRYVLAAVRAWRKKPA
ncbi:MAG: hypothetical protein IT555_19010 [Acetobacteraceae bacterium]|nr:hypothetical protein [Acetobacteraceae bacterium]